MAIVTMYSKKSTAGEIMDDLASQYAALSPEGAWKLALIFSTTLVDIPAIGGRMKEILDDVTMMGCTTAGEIVDGMLLKNSVVVMLLDDTVVDDVHVEVLETVKKSCDVTGAFKEFERYYSVAVCDLDVEKYVGIILADGLSGAEERLMDSIGNQTNIHVIGASAGDDLKFEKTCIFANGKCYSDAAALAIVKMKRKFDFIKTQSFNVLNKKLVATKVNEEMREVIEFNNKPATEAYAEVLGVPVDDIENHFMTNPVGLMVDHDPYVRSPQQVVGTAMRFYCNIKQGMELAVLESADIVKDTSAALEKKRAELGSISGIINFHCILRTLELENKRQVGAYGRIFSGTPTIGFSTYGEMFVGHINQTSTMLVFK